MLPLKVLASNLHGIGVNQVLVYSEVRVKRIVCGARGGWRYSFAETRPKPESAHGTQTRRTIMN